MWKFKKFDIAIPFHQYSNSIQKHFGGEKFSSEAFPVDSHLTEHPRFKTRRINVMFNKRAAIFLSGLKSLAKIDTYMKSTWKKIKCHTRLEIFFRQRH